jgi:hypothetical protein
MAEKLINLWEALESAFRKFQEAREKPAPDKEEASTEERDRAAFTQRIDEATDHLQTIEKLRRLWRK